MARKNNKGFSVIEIIIAITILSLLLVPIVKQISQTLRTSRQAKRQQYAMDNAVYLMEDFQKSSMDELNAKYGAPTKKADTVQCQIYDTSGNIITGALVSYSAYSYDAGVVNLGHEKTSYTRTVILDDLSTALMGYDVHNVDTSVAVNTKGYKMVNATVAIEGFTLNSEGHLVKYDSNGYVVGAVCDVADRVDNPNEINLGNMQNMDSSTVAIIPGSATNFDSQAENAFFSLAMEKLKENHYADWIQAMGHTKSDSILNQHYNLANTTKVTKVYVDKGNDGKDYYVVSVDVCYENTSLSKTLNYNVFSQKFYMNECPAVYMEYQPYTAQSGADSVIYAANDYILIDNYVDDAKIYLYKPFRDQMNVVATVTDAEHVAPSDGYVFYQQNGGSAPVTIHLCSATSAGSPSNVYTNINLSTFNTDAFSGFTSVTAEHGGAREDYTGLKSLSEDRRTQDRLYTINVILTPDAEAKSANDVSLTGAKGEN